MTTKKTLVILAGVIALSAIGLAFYPFEKVQAPALPTYDQNSRKTLIPEDCKHFNDGCNTCFRAENGEAACTRMFCESYRKPYCTDEENQVKNPDFIPSCDDTDGLSQCEISAELEEQAQRFLAREEAKAMILEGKVKNIFQKHNLEVVLTTEEGDFLTREPKIDEVFEVIQECGELCKAIPLATE